MYRIDLDINAGVNESRGSFISKLRFSLRATTLTSVMATFHTTVGKIIKVLTSTGDAMVLHLIQYGLPNSILEESGSSVGTVNNVDTKEDDSRLRSQVIKGIPDSYEDAIQCLESA